MGPLKRRAEEFGYHYPIVEVKRGGRSGSIRAEGKSDRVMSLQTPYTYKQVWHADTIKNGRTEEQLLRFRPNPKDHDDFRDALAMLWQEATRRRYGKRTRAGWKVGNVGGRVTYASTGV